MSASVYWSILAVLCLGLLIEGAVAIRKPRAWPFICLSSAVFLWLRYPAWSWLEQNPDEAQAIATAITLWHDPRFWLSVDAGTHGPFVSVPLLFGRLFFSGIDFVSARCVGALLLAAAMAFTFDVARRYFGEVAARVGTLVVLLPMGSSVFPDFIAYNGEMPMVFFSALACWLLVRALEDGSERMLFVGCAAAGILPWVKLQGAPTVIALGVPALLVLLHKPKRRLLIALAGGAAPTVLILLYVASIGAFGDFVHGYLSFAFSYIERDGKTAARRFASQSTWVLNARHTFPFIKSMLEGALLLLPAMLLPPVRRLVHPIVSIGVLLLGCAGLYEVYQPGHPFVHYLVVLTFPAALITAAAIAVFRAFPHRHARAAGLAICTAYVLFVPARTLWARKAPFVIGARPDPIAHLTPLINRYAQPGDRLVVWGWMARFHAFTQLPQGVRYAVMWQLDLPDVRFMPNFLSDFDSAPVALFLDAVAPAGWNYTNEAKYGFEQFPAIVERLQRDYELAWEIQGFRLYVRRDRMLALQAQSVIPPK